MNVTDDRVHVTECGICHAPDGEPCVDQGIVHIGRRWKIGITAQGSRFGTGDEPVIGDGGRCRPTTEDPSDVCRIIAELYTLARLDGHRSTGRLTLDSTHRHADPNIAVGAAIIELQTAAEAIEAVTRSLQQAQNDIAAIAMDDQ